MTVIPLKLDNDIVEKLDLLVKMRIYKTRNEALRHLIQNGLEKIVADALALKVKGEESIIETLLTMARKGIDVIKITSKETASELVAEERNR